MLIPRYMIYIYIAALLLVYSKWAPKISICLMKRVRHAKWSNLHQFWTFTCTSRDNVPDWESVYLKRCWVRSNGRHSSVRWIDLQRSFWHFWANTMVWCAPLPKRIILCSTRAFLTIRPMVLEMDMTTERMACILQTGEFAFSVVTVCQFLNLKTSRIWIKAILKRCKKLK